MGQLVGPLVPVHSLWGTLPYLYCLSNPSLESVALSVDDPGFVPVHQVVLFGVKLLISDSPELLSVLKHG